MSHFGVPHTVNHAASGALRRNGKAAMSRIDRSKSRSAGGKGFYIALALCLAAVGAIGYFTLIRPANVTIDDPTPPARQTERNDAQWTAPVLQPEPIEVPAVEEEPAPEPEDLLPQVVSPLDGTTVTVFSTTELMYDETMADWRTHNGLDIQAAEGDAVKTAASGMVVSIKSDELMGTTVVIEHAGGYTTQYSCLQAEPPVTEGQQVAAGDIIGLVGSTAAAESSMGPHLHFCVAKEGVIIARALYWGYALQRSGFRPPTNQAPKNGPAAASPQRGLFREPQNLPKTFEMYGIFG